ncbi:ribosome biogenesis GTP-binding protein YsxC [Sulfurihydrogenibium azorense Az-Fu1]|uniref:Probable GTP-binding protein EngB n=1 Tax=Sulfurihydrogenibium azorense (strain DSM 15241 / OCM 825 / Az-Fu1) TaxID=204536 RepID=C1DTD8_SULAA|nr:ribosome biogenesis GTP-binding protein YihA/YsxC [Sulfurihydrogenibium azorense]ACN99697.1 ribosome biogenesis GTP-binding protein YsxC [Sulfurihydrogenibium azorense Az-Fu1]
MSIKSVEFIKSAVKPEDYPPPDKPEVAVVGRSNVGKSSLINAIFKRSVAKVSSTPGKTRLINFFTLNNDIYFVDLPGYGFASVSQKERLSWQKMIENYLLNRENLKLIIMLVDTRYPPTNLDILMKQWLDTFEKQYFVVGTKIDKLNQSEKAKAKKVIKETLDLDDNTPIFLVSAKEGTGIDNLVSEIFKAVKE